MAAAEDPGRAAAGLSETEAWLAGIWGDVLGAEVGSASDDFFAFGGGSLTAAQLVGRIRERYPEAAVGDVYAYPTIGTLAGALEDLGGRSVAQNRQVTPIPPKTQGGQLLALVPLRTLAAGRWLAWLMLASTLLGAGPGPDWLPAYPWWVLVLTTAFLVLPSGRMVLTAGLARLILRGLRPGTYPRGGKVHLRIWLASRIADEFAATTLGGALWFRFYARLLGARIDRGVDLHSLPPITGLLDLGRGCSIEPEVDLSGCWIDGDRLHVGAIRIGERARIGTRSMLGPGAVVEDGAEVAAGSFVTGTVTAREFWSGAPAEPMGAARGPWSPHPPPQGRGWLIGYGVVSALLSLLPGIAVLAGLSVCWPAARSADSVSDALARAWLWLPLAALTGYAVLGGLVLVLVRLFGRGIRTGHFPVRSLPGICIWGTLHLLDEARTWLFPLYSGALTPWWLRLLGARIGTGVEASTVLLIPKLTQVNDHAFLADDTLIGGYELGGGWIRVERVKVGKRAFVGNSGMAAPGRKVPKSSLVAVLSAAPTRGTAEPGSSWLGSPPTRLRRATGRGDESLTYHPPRRLHVLRGLVETCRLVPMLLGVCLYTGVAATLLLLLQRAWWLAWLGGGLVLASAGVVAAAVTWAAKWVLTGRHRPSEHPLWSSFVWRNELADTFMEVLAAPWFASVTLGTPALNAWFRMLGARIGRGVWCDTYWLPETDLIVLGDGATVNHGCVVQTHLFHDRVLAMDTVTLQAGATLGPNSVILPAATIGRHATIGPVSLVMRGESVPSRTRWIGNPIGPWEDR